VDNEDDLGLATTPTEGISFETPGLILNSNGFYQLNETRDLAI